MAETLLLVHLTATLVMIGTTWFVQIVHYPLFGGVGTMGFPAYSEAHSRRTSCTAGPPTLTEAATAVLLVFFRPEGVARLDRLVMLSQWSPERRVDRTSNSRHIWRRVTRSGTYDV